jgi:ubiquinone/menaquinone biosynthesis C-methylase UbiE
MSAAAPGASELLAAHFGVRVIGIDPSLKMLDQARCKPMIGDVLYCRGTAEALPLRDGCADLLVMLAALRTHGVLIPEQVGR